MKGLPDYDEALARALGAARPLDRSDRVSIDDGDGRVLREPIIADRELPPFDRAQVDGYALRAHEVGRVEAWVVAHTIAAGTPANVRVPPGACVAIATGAPVPDALDAVIEHELSDRADPVRFTVRAVEPGRAIHHRGADARRGETLVEPGTHLAPHTLAIAAAVGRASLDVAVRPRAVVLTSGDEVKPVEGPVQAHQIRDSNGPLVRALLRRFGAEVVACEHVADERDATIDAVRRALVLADLVVTVGGVSAGERDHFPAAFEACEIVEHLRGAAIQPGKPILVGAADVRGRNVVVLSLPGNPVSALVCACLFGWPIVRRLLGLDPGLPWRTATCAEQVKPNAKRRAFRPAMLHADGSVTVPRWAGSGDLAHTALTHGVVRLPVRDDPVERGEVLPFLAWPGTCN